MKREEEGSGEYDYVWVTVGRRKNSYDLRVREPKSLQQNQFAYRLRIPFDRDAWFDRIEEVDMITVDSRPLLSRR